MRLKSGKEFMNRIRKKDITVIIPMYNSEKTIKTVRYSIIK